MTRYAGMMEEEEIENQETMDFSHFELLKTVKKAGIEAVSYTHLDVYKRQVWLTLFYYGAE